MNTDTVPVQMKYQWEYVYGTMEVTCGDAQLRYLPTVPLHCSCLFLQQLVATDPDAVHIVSGTKLAFRHTQRRPICRLKCVWLSCQLTAPNSN